MLYEMLTFDDSNFMFKFDFPRYAFKVHYLQLCIHMNFAKV